MFTAVHSDRSGRVYVSADWGAAAFDGLATGPLEVGVPLPPGAALVPLERDAEGVDRAGHVRALGTGRWAVGAVLPGGFTRTHHPAYREDPARDAPLAPRATAAVGADDGGNLYAAAIRTVEAARPRDEGEPSAADGARVAEAPAHRPGPPRAWPSVRSGNRLLRQLSRCARENACDGARAALRGTGTAAMPVCARPNEASPAAIATRTVADESPREPAAIRPSAAEIAEVAGAHLAAGGQRLSFGRACEGEPLMAVTLLEEAVARVSSAWPGAPVHLETNGSSPAALRRIARAGLREVTVRLVSAQSDTYEVLHGPDGYRFADVRASLRVARDAGLAIELAVPVLPGLTDRERELDALVSLANEARAAVVLRDLAADARAALALAPLAGSAVGIEAVAHRLLEGR